VNAIAAISTAQKQNTGNRLVDDMYLDLPTPAELSGWEGHLDQLASISAND
jgi:hypothetical protein